MTVAVWHREAHEAARAHQAQLTKPPGALGRLEELACWLAGCQGQAVPRPLRVSMALFAADHGVAAEGVSAFPQVVTVEMVKNFVAGGAAINVLARQHGIALRVIDVGVAGDLSAMGDAIVHARVAHGSGNIAREPAMDAGQMEAALSVGRRQAAEAIAAGADLLIAGEMGIANTTPAAALICALLEHEPDVIVGRGTGVDDAGLRRKIDAVQRSLARAGTDLPPDRALQQLGGLEIAAICGFLQEAAARGVPALLDGFIVTAAALVAERMQPGSVRWWQAAHCSQEQGHRLVLQALALEPLLDFGLRLGEGSGAALAVPLLQAAVALHCDMATFDTAGVSTAD